MLARAKEESIENWVNEYIYSDIHDIFFVEFSIVLHEWLSRLVTRIKKFQEREVVEWNDQLI